MASFYSKIVVGTDGSDAANNALRHAGELARATGAEVIHIVMASRRVERAEVLDALDNLPESWDAEPDLYASDKYVLVKAAELMKPYGVAVETHLVSDAPADALIATAEREGAELIVVGSRGHGAGARLFLGSVSTKVVHHAHGSCSVLVVSCGD